MIVSLSVRTSSLLSVTLLNNILSAIHPLLSSLVKNTAGILLTTFNAIVYSILLALSAILHTVHRLLFVCSVEHTISLICKSQCCFRALHEPSTRLYSSQITSLRIQQTASLLLATNSWSTLAANSWPPLAANISLLLQHTAGLLLATNS